MGNILLYSLSLSSFSSFSPFLLSILFLSFFLPPSTLSPFPSSCKLFITLVGLELKMNKQRSTTTSLTDWRLLFFLFVKINFFVLFYLHAISSHVTRIETKNWLAWLTGKRGEGRGAGLPLNLCMIVNVNTCTVNIQHTIISCLLFNVLLSIFTL